MWSKRPKPGGKGLRCEIEVRRGTEMVRCDRPAKRFRQEQRECAHWISPFRTEVAVIDLCVGHLRKLVNDGFDLERVDRRKVKAR